MVIIMIVMVTMVIMVIKVVRVASVKPFIGIFTHQGHISKVNANAHSVSNSVTQSVTLITSRASCDAKYTHHGHHHDCNVTMVIIVIMVIMVVRVASVKSSIGIFTHQGHISKFNANDQ